MVPFASVLLRSAKCVTMMVRKSPAKPVARGTQKLP